MAEDLHFGAQFEAGPPAETRELARHLEEAGYDAIWVPDHVSFHSPIYEALTHLAFIAAVTERIRIGSAVVLLPLRSPGLAAKQIATLDVLAEGRLTLGVGVGGEAPVEFDLCGVPVRERGARANEAIQVLKLLWSGKRVDFEGRFSRFKGVQIDPPPVQMGGPPIWIGGRSKAALRRAARLGDGYASYVLTPEGIRAAAETIRREADMAGRDLKNFEFGHLFFITVRPTYEQALDQSTEILSARYRQDFAEASRKYNVLGPPAECAEQLRRFVDAGVRNIILSPCVPHAERAEQFDILAREVIPLLRG